MPNSLTTRRLIGYARVSTQGQDLAYQLERLKSAGCQTIFQEKRSGKNTEDRPELHRVLAFLQVGDVLLATVGDRIARDPLDMLLILGATRKAGAKLRLLDEPFDDTASEMDDLVAYVYGWAARQQRLRILVNTAAGRERARRRGVKFGRKPKLDARQRRTIVERHANGEPYARLAAVYGVSESTILRVCH